jgi:hypothetical protein
MELVTVQYHINFFCDKAGVAYKFYARLLVCEGTL